MSTPAATATNNNKKHKKRSAAAAPEEKAATTKIDTVIQITEAFRGDQKSLITIRWKNVEQLHVHRTTEFCNCRHLDALIHECMKRKDSKFTNTMRLSNYYSHLMSVKPAEETQAVDIDFSVDNPPATDHWGKVYEQGSSVCCRKLEDYLDPLKYHKF